MGTSVTQEQGRVPVTVLHVSGNLDAATADAFRQRAEGLIKAGSQNLLIDLSEVPYVSSAGLRALNQLFSLLHGESRENASQEIRAGTFKSPHLKLLNPSPRVLDVLKMSGFDMFLEIHPNLRDAVASF